MNLKQICGICTLQKSKLKIKEGNAYEVKKIEFN